MNPLKYDRQVVDALVSSIKKNTDNCREYRIMEVCGTHTMSIAKFGIKSLLPENINLISGPGCPVCVTAQGDIDSGISLSEKKDVVICTFGDMMRLKSSDGRSLYEAKAGGAEILVVYSPLDVLNNAVKNPQKLYVFLAVGFETTAPMVAGLLKTVWEKSIENLAILSFLKTMPKALELLINDSQVRIDAFLCPGNVTVITGTGMYEPIASCNKAAVVTGFEPIDILSSVLEAVKQINSGEFRVVNNYWAAKDIGNIRARELVNVFFNGCDALWRGLGVIKNSGLTIKDDFKRFDAAKVFNIPKAEEDKNILCKCGEILKGVITPVDCPMFGKGCIPENAYGPCMVSSEGACAAYYKYSR